MLSLQPTLPAPSDPPVGGPSSATSRRPGAPANKSTPPSRPPRPPVSPLILIDQEDMGVIERLYPSSAFHTHLNRQFLSSSSSAPTSAGPSSRKQSDGSPPADASFWRWSQATSSLAPSVSLPPSAYSSLSDPPTSRQQPADKDRSYLRLTRTTIFSDFSAPSTVPDVLDLSTLPTPFERPSKRGVLSPIPEATATSLVNSYNEREEINSTPDPKELFTKQINVHQREKEHRSSAGTLGNKNRRWSAVASTSTHSGVSKRLPESEDPFRDNHEAKSQAVGEFNESVRAARRRPVSLSSAADSTFTNSAYSGIQVMDDTMLAARSAVGVLPSADKRQVHRKLESERAIAEYLIKQTMKNDRRIVPSESALRRSRPEPPPLNGTGEVDRFGPDEPASSTALPPPPRGHHTLSLLHTRFAIAPSAAVALHARTRAHTNSSADRSHHTPSVSLDSLPSLHPSITESIATDIHGKPLPSFSSRFADNRRRTISQAVEEGLPDLTSKMDLTPEQRSLLLRRTRKLEQMLGKTLPEIQVENLVVEPMRTTSTYVTNVKDDVWPVTPPQSAGGRRRTPEWEREDCVPQRAHGSSSTQAAELTKGASSSRSGGTLTRKARAVLGFAKRMNNESERSADIGCAMSGEGGETEMREYASREQRTAQTISRGGHISSPTTSANRIQQEPEHQYSPTGSLTPTPTENGDQYKSSLESSPATPKTTGWPSPEIRSYEEGREGDEESIRRNRRQQFAKLHRLLGTPVPPELVNSKPAPITDVLHPGSSLSPSDQSFMTFDEDDDDVGSPSRISTKRNIWTVNRLRNTLSPNGRKAPISSTIS
ncbi:hypothetical protein IAR55_003409 [Kwoniella newhampshirensis]|uniref:Uncharacterized protein n=1 Tax=Kwoniella newhampshirensis TaxID=1651941 RepID=A0AAW0YMF0_9TREE